MAIFAMLSAGGSPGVTTAALALTLSWPDQVIIAECDPSGGDILAGLLSGHLPAATGLLPLALEAGAGAEVPADTLWRQLVELDEEHSRLLLAGISDPRQSAALQSSLPWIAEALQGLRADVLADCGRLDALAAVRPVLSAATLAVLVLQPTLRQVSRAIPRVEMLTNLMGPGRVVVLLVGAGAASSREVTKTLGVPVVGQLPDDPKTAAVLSDGLGRRRRLDERPLIRAAAAVGRGIRAAAGSAGPRPGAGGQPVYTPYATDQPAADGFLADQPVPDRPAGPPVLGRAPSRPGGYGPGQPGPGGYPPAPPAGDPAPYDDPAPYAASPPAAGDRDDRDSGASGWDPADAGWPALMPCDPGRPDDLSQPGNPGQPGDTSQPGELSRPSYLDRPGEPGPPGAPGRFRDPSAPYQPGHSRDPSPFLDQRPRPPGRPAPSGEPPWGARSSSPDQPAPSYESRWPSPDRPSPREAGQFESGQFESGHFEADHFEADHFATGRFGADQYRVFGSDQYRAAPDEPGDAPADPDEPRFGPAQNGSR